jgi:hypothetical protein
MRLLVPRLFCLTLVIAILAVSLTPADAPIAPNAKAPGDTLSRLIIQDASTCSLVWADVRITAKDEFGITPSTPIEGFKKLDPAKQKLVQMKESNKIICVGVRDNEDGKSESGWILANSGVRYTDHGDHGHWIYKTKPSVIDHRLDNKQGNPAHMYLYDGRFFLANDKLNGYTRIDPKMYDKGGKDTPRFLVGGGNHITLAVVDDKVGYSAWIDGAGPNKGKVDVTPVTKAERSEPKYSFTLPSGGIHGAIANSGKVFFAPSEGVCWVQADTQLTRKGDEVKVHHIDLGKDGDKALRTGAFVNHSHYVLFNTGKAEKSELVLLDAKKDEIKPIRVPLAVKPGTRALTPILGVTPEKKAFAFIFHDRAKDVEAEDVLEVVAMDPNGDGDCSDAKVIKTLKVGKSEVEGHFGHHDLAFDADGRYGFITNPGNGTVSVLSLKKMEIVATLNVGGKPGAVIAVGGREMDD